MAMSPELLLAVLGWCSVINLGLVMWWFFAFVTMRDFIFRMHMRWFNLTPNQFDLVHYSGMAIFKFLILFLNLIPYIALRIVL